MVDIAESILTYFDKGAPESYLKVEANRMRA
jgi:hypothetical protein